MSKKKKLRKQTEERFQRILPYLVAMYACLGVEGLSSHIASHVESGSVMYWISVGAIVIAGTTLLILLNRALKEDQE